MHSSDPGSYRHVEVDGAKVAYRITGDGPAVVLIKNNRRPRDLGAAELLASHHRVVQIHPVGFGASDRPTQFAFGDVGRQVTAVLDRESIADFVVWGFSQTAAMAALVARSTTRAVGLIAGGFPLIAVPSDSQMRRMEHEPRMPTASLEFWRAYRALDWHHELRVMAQPSVVYLGTDDPAVRQLRRVAPVLRGCGCDCLELAGLDHSTGGLADTGPGVRASVAAITSWCAEKLPEAW